MPDLKRTIEILFEGKDSTKKIFAQIEGNIASFTGVTTTQMKSAAIALGGVTTVLAGVATAGLKMSSDMETAMEKMKASLGLSTDTAEELKDIATNIFTAGNAQDINEALETVQSTFVRFRDSAIEDVEAVATATQKIVDVFGKDYDEVLRGISTLTNEMGYDIQTATGFIVTGFQNGLDKSGDFIDSIAEYGRFFEEAKAGPEDFFSIMETGLSESTTLGTDKALDVFKEFTLRVGDESKKTKDALEKIGIDETILRENLDTGKTTLFEAFQLIQTRVGDLEGEINKKNIIADLFGAPGEDLGTEMLLALGKTKTSIEDINDAVEDLDIDSFEKDFTSAWRTILQSFVDNDVWKDLQESIRPFLVEIADVIPESFEGIGDDIDFQSVQDAFQTVLDSIQTIFSSGNLKDLSDSEINSVLQGIIDGVSKMVEVVAGTVTSFIGGIEAAWGGTKTFFYGTASLILEAAQKITEGLSLVTFGDFSEEMDAASDALALSFKDLQDKALDAASDTRDGVDTFFEGIKLAAVGSTAEVEKVGNAIEEVPTDKAVVMTVTAEGADAEDVKKLLGDKIKTTAKVTVEPKVDENKLSEAKSKIDEIPALKRLELETDLKIEQIKAQADIAAEAFKFRAEVDIAEIEAGTKRIETLAESANELFRDTGSVIQSLFGQITQADSIRERFAIERQLSKENEYRERALEISESLTKEQIKYMQERRKRLESGDALITVNGDGLAPYLEMIMYELLGYVQIRATEEGVNSLLGLP